MSNNIKSKIWLIGASQMAVDYSKIFNKLGLDYEVLGNSTLSAKKFEKQINKKVWTGGLESIIANDRLPIPDFAIVAVGIEKLKDISNILIKLGVNNLLIEKPAGININEIKLISKKNEKKNTRIIVGYNRRCFASVKKAKEIIVEDGGVTSFNFEFTEWSHIIKDLNKKQEIKENWFLANSTHVVDLAFFLGGRPQTITCFTQGNLDWHPSASIFAGAGRSENNALYTYSANWEAPGRWSVEILTRKHRLVLSPMEKLQIQKIGSIEREFVEIDYQYDNEFKPGLYIQVKNFLERNDNDLCTLNEHLINCELYSRILKGNH